MSMIALVMSMAVQSANPYIAPPTVRKAPDCTCPASSSPDVVIKGYVIDAEVTLGADRRSVEDRMATIFDVKYSTDDDFSGRTRIWHHVSAEYCGVTFDYGKKYTVKARYDEDGELETDACLMSE
ncbi:hypothetical protein [Hyphococcus sp.]|uniref:hypothetical protein n=1 Tax=Hyphococcus sp. TaxID=2038636 RepID=UPI002086DDA2|nr:MAG: hypothetical protein DHS20C04_17580 [Marinicaulis sp.]